MSTVASNETDELVVPVNGSRPKHSHLVRELRDVAVAVPLFATSPLEALASPLRRDGCRGRGADAGRRARIEE
jgi:hypothetical protein